MLFLLILAMSDSNIDQLSKDLLNHKRQSPSSPDYFPVRNQLSNYKGNKPNSFSNQNRPGMRVNRARFKKYDNRGYKDREQYNYSKNREDNERNDSQSNFFQLRQGNALSRSRSRSFDQQGEKRDQNRNYIRNKEHFQNRVNYNRKQIKPNPPGNYQSNPAPRRSFEMAKTQNIENLPKKNYPYLLILSNNFYKFIDSNYENIRCEIYDRIKDLRDFRIRTLEHSQERVLLIDADELSTKSYCFRIITEKIFGFLSERYKNMTYLKLSILVPSRKNYTNYRRNRVHNRNRREEHK